MRGPIHETVWRVGITVRPYFESEWILVSRPSCQSRLQFLAEIRAHVEVGDSGAATEPLQHSSAGKICIESLNVNRHSSQRLKCVEHHVGADLVRFLNDCLGVVDVGTAKDDMR